MARLKMVWIQQELRGCSGRKVNVPYHLGTHPCGPGATLQAEHLPASRKAIPLTGFAPDVVRESLRHHPEEQNTRSRTGLLNTGRTVYGDTRVYKQQRNPSSHNCVKHGRTSGTQWIKKESRKHTRQDCVTHIQKRMNWHDMGRGLATRLL